MATHEHSSTQLQDSLNQELLNLSKTPEITKQDRFCVHKVCFEKLIDHHSTYRDLLYRIKAEYEECIEAIERGQREAVFLSGKLASTLMQPETIRNLKQRGDELELKIKLLKVLNQRLESPLKSSCRTSSKQHRQSYLNSSNCISEGSFLTWDHSRSALRSYFLPSFTVEQLTNTAFLTKKLADLKSRVAVVKLEDKTRFVPKALKGQLFKRLREKEEIKEVLLSKREKLKMKIMSIQLSMAVQANKSKTRPVVYRGAFGNIALALKQTKEAMEKADEMCQETKDGPETVCDSQSSICILGEVDTIRTENAQLLEEKFALEQENNELKMRETERLAEIAASVETIRMAEAGLRLKFNECEEQKEDPAKDREAEFILEYIENFFELFEEGKVEEAVLHAAHSPKGVLRTMETLKQFKEYDASNGDSSLFVAYWEALLPTVATGCNKPSEWETIECIKCLLDKNRVDLLTHWIAQDLLTLSTKAGKLIMDACQCHDNCKCGLAGLAEGVFESIAAYREVLECFLRQGKYYTAVEYTEKNSNLTRKDFLEAFQNVPLTDSIVSTLCNEYTENHLLSVQEAEDTLSRVLVGHACRRVARKMYGEKDFHSRQS